MAVIFREVSFPPLESLSATAPNGAVIGLIGEDNSGKRILLRLAAGDDKPLSGQVSFDEPARLIGVADALNFAPVATLALDHALARHDALVRFRTLVALDRLRRAGATIFLSSHEQDLLRTLCDEVWWLHEGKLAAKGDPAEVIEKFNRHVSQRLRDWGQTVSQPLSSALRRGDGRAELLSVETLDADEKPTMVWESGQPVAVRVVVRFAAAVPDPVVGIMIRTRIGFEVYGTNTELERVTLGPCQPGDTLKVTYSFRCDLCPQQYTLTAASHDPDGVWHDWLEDAVAFAVTDSRYTAGVANLRAAVKVEKL